MPRPLTALALTLCLVAAACGGDDDTESADTSTTHTGTVAEQPAATQTDTAPETTTAPASDEETISRSDAEQEAARQALVAADDVPDSDLYFPSGEDVECEAPGATQPDNANEQAPEWDCTLDSETNGVRCEGTVTVFASPGANPGKTFEGIDVRDPQISCASA